ncbi:hypothetical protein [Streptomyces sp. LN500]|uniref:hypothetical protein n=1 Tax=Streptomyces sp. LN500 TaxID=3112978 RepID=UPI00371DE914
MTYLDPFAGRSSVDLQELLEFAHQWDLYDASIDGQQRMPKWYRGVRYENWWGSGATLQQVHLLAKNHGIAVAWVPPAGVIRDLVRADESHEAKLAVLVAAKDEIRAACRQRYAPDIGEAWPYDYRLSASYVLDAWDDGHILAAACLALAAAEDLMYEVSRVDRSKKYKGLKQRAGRDLLEWWPDHEQVALAPIEPLFSTYFPERDDPIPENLSRHAALHRLPLEHLSDGHCIVAIMLMISLLRELERRLVQEQIDAWSEEQEYLEEDGEHESVD